ncbi:unannotated protein [freshwater metagenome]|uniref:Unannotated protein n=1 Tax=freshwater metagenome TaxID=449393 RepID=A0A6J7BZ09_9ZZZZ
MVHPHQLAGELAGVGDAHQWRLIGSNVLWVDRDSIEAKAIEHRIGQEVVTCPIAIGQKAAVVDVHLVADLYATEANDAGLAAAIAEVEVVSRLGAIQLASAGYTVEHLNTHAEAVARSDAGDLNGDREVGGGAHVTPGECRAVHLCVLGCEEHRVADDVADGDHPSDGQLDVDDIAGDGIG